MAIRSSLAALALIAVTACGGRSATTGDPAIDPVPLVFCCDPNAGFPQLAGAITFSYTGEGSYDVTANEAANPMLEIDPGGDVDQEVSEDANGVFMVSVLGCGDHTATIRYQAYTSSGEDATPVDIPVPVHDRCPVTDPEDLVDGDPSVDLTSVTTGHTPVGVPWAHAGTAGAFPPPDTLYSWFIQVLFRDSNGATLVDCTHQRHDGSSSTFCATGDVNQLEVRELSSGPVFIFGGAATAAEFTVTGGVAPTDTSAVATDVVSGTVDDAIGDPPGEDYDIVPRNDGT